MRAQEHCHKECGIDWSRPVEAKKMFVEGHFTDWSQTAKHLVLNSDVEVVPRPIYMLPVGMTWPHKPRSAAPKRSDSSC